MTPNQLKYMTEKFLGWKLPDNFNPDGGITFKKEYNENTPWPMKHEPTGTNLLDFDQAYIMMYHITNGMPDK